MTSNNSDFIMERDSIHVDEPESCLQCDGIVFYSNVGEQTRFGFRTEFYCRKCKAKYKILEPYCYYLNTGHLFKLVQSEIDKMKVMLENG